MQGAVGLLGGVVSAVGCMAGGGTGGYGSINVLVRCAVGLLDEGVGRLDRSCSLQSINSDWVEMSWRG